MRSTSLPSDPVQARLFDGSSARAHLVTAAIEGDALVVQGERGDVVPLALLTREIAAGRVVLHRSDLPDWRLIVGGNDAFSGVAARHRLKRRHGGWIGAAVAGVAALGLLVWAFGSRALVLAAPWVPRSVAVQAGSPMADVIAGGERRCRAEAGSAALRKLVGRVIPRRPVEAVQVRVGRDEGVNAFTLPGGQVVILSGLIDAARTPDEVAGVLAHEFGHVQKRHPNQALLRHFGFDVFAQGLGGNVGSLAATGLFLRNSRAAEREADGVALDLLREGAVSPTGLADFFRRLEAAPERKARGGRLGQLASLVATHPSDDSRQTLFRAAAGAWRAEPVLTPAEWRALKAICRRDAPQGW